MKRVYSTLTIMYIITMYIPTSTPNSWLDVIRGQFYGLPHQPSPTSTHQLDQV